MRFQVINPKYAIGGTVYFSILALLGSGLAVWLEVWYLGLFFGLLFAVFTWLFTIKHNLLRTLTISESGLVYRAFRQEYYLAWPDVKTIRVVRTPMPLGRSQPWIILAAEDLDHLPEIALRLGHNAPGYFSLQYRPNVVAALQQYWQPGILGLEALQPRQAQR